MTFTFDQQKSFEICRIEIESGGHLEAQPHLPGSEEYLTVFSGEVEVGLPDQSYFLKCGDSLRFPSDQNHSYRNPGVLEARLSMLIWYKRS